MKQFTIIFAILFFSINVNAQIITGEVEYNNDISYSQIRALNFDELRNKFFDRDNIENLNYLLQGITELKDRKLAQFSDGSYAVQYYDTPLYSWYYSSSGKLINYTQKNSLSYPCVFTKFKPNGNIVQTGRRLSESESFIYDTNGKLAAHWIGKNCYDKNNNLIMTRKIIE